MDSSQLRRIQEHMPVVCSDNEQFGTVDQVEGKYIKLTAKEAPDKEHHWIPVAWITSVDDKVHIDRTKDQAMREQTRGGVVTGTEVFE